MNIYIPLEIVNLIADYHDYEKYCKSKHKELFKDVLFDLVKIFNIFPGNYINPNLVYICWGNGWNHYNSSANFMSNQIYLYINNVRILYKFE